MQYEDFEWRLYRSGDQIKLALKNSDYDYFSGLYEATIDVSPGRGNKLNQVYSEGLYGTWKGLKKFDPNSARLETIHEIA